MRGRTAYKPEPDRVTYGEGYLLELAYSEIKGSRKDRGKSFFERLFK